jgi:hypothetical protein
MEVRILRPGVIHRRQKQCSDLASTTCLTADIVLRGVARTRHSLNELPRMSVRSPTHAPVLDHPHISGARLIPCAPAQVAEGCTLWGGNHDQLGSKGIDRVGNENANAQYD